MMNAAISDQTAATTTYFAVGVKSSSRGRTWYRADSSSCGVRELVERLARDLAAANPGTPVALLDAKAGHSCRPSSLRLAHDHLYDGLDDDDVDLDALPDDEL